jgi:biopolymer transport protein ExbB
MAGISSALVATALGIFVAVPAVIANNAFHTRLKRLTTNAQSLIHMAQVYLRDETIARHRPGGPKGEREGTATEPVVMEMSV